jgi:hypothetical protein
LSGIDEGVAAMMSSDVMIVRIALPDRAVLGLQGLLMAEDGLATLRGEKGGSGELELWSTWAQERELDDWLTSLPTSLELKVLERYAFEPATKSGAEGVS